LRTDKFAKCEIFDTVQCMWGNSSPGALAARFARLVEQLGGDTAAAKALGQQRDLLAAVEATSGGTLNQVAGRVKRGAPAVSRAIELLVRAGLVDRQPDPNNRRRLQLRLTEAGRSQMNQPPVSDGSLEGRIGKLAHSELRALERGIEILERLPR
jgi:DNA-binding MarR family transcriptional regulator